MKKVVPKNKNQEMHILPNQKFEGAEIIKKSSFRVIENVAFHHPTYFQIFQVWRWTPYACTSDSGEYF